MIEIELEILLGDFTKNEICGVDGFVSDLRLLEEYLLVLVDLLHKSFGCALRVRLGGESLRCRYGAPEVPELLDLLNYFFFVVILISKLIT